jgi:nicotinamidase-related amidase
MREMLVVVDMQNDFIDGALGTGEAVAIVEEVEAMINAFHGEIIFTRDTHTEDYMSTREGKNLPVPHCIKGTHGHDIREGLMREGARVFDKPTFGSLELQRYIMEENLREPIDAVTFVGLCTDICVISNAMLIKAALPECEIGVVESACAGVTPDSHKNALEAMKMCHIKVYPSVFEFVGGRVLLRHADAFRELAKY